MIIHIRSNKKTKIIFDCQLIHYPKTNKIKMHGFDTGVVRYGADRLH